MKHVSDFVRATGAKWFVPLFLLVLLVQVAQLTFILQGEPTVAVLGMASLGAVGLLVTLGLAFALVRKTLHLEEARQDSETDRKSVV